MNILASPTGNPFAACTAFFLMQECLHTCVCVCVCEYVKTTFALGIATADSTRIISTLAHLGWTRGTHHHSTESLPSFLTGLETEKNKGRGRESWRGGLLFYILKLAQF